MGLPTLAALTEKLEQFIDEVDGIEGDFVEDAAGEALELVTNHVRNGTDDEGAPTYYDIPDRVAMRACVEVGADLFYRRTARNGLVAVNSLEVSAVRIQRDPMTAAYPILSPFTGKALA